jgi:hypothetical protein
VLIIIGVDPHKRTHTASAVDATSNRTVSTVQIEATLPGSRQLRRWSAQFPRGGGRWRTRGVWVLTWHSG